MSVNEVLVAEMSVDKWGIEVNSDLFKNFLKLSRFWQSSASQLVDGALGIAKLLITTVLRAATNWWQLGLNVLTTMLSNHPK
jgi:hypothetical protein